MSELTSCVTGRAFLESPRWHDGALYLSDMFADEVLRVSADGEVSTVVEVEQPSGLGWLPDGTLLISSMAQRRVLRFDGERLTEHADVRAVAAQEINDMVVDRHGTAFLGQFGFDPRSGGAPVAADLIRISAGGAVSVAATGLNFANGMAITTDGSTLLVAESIGQCITAFTLSDDGVLTDRRVWAKVDGFPDGIAVDRENGVWFASPVSSQFLRVIDGGEVTDTVDTPGPHGIACTRWRRRPHPVHADVDISRRPGAGREGSWCVGAQHAGRRPGRIVGCAGPSGTDIAHLLRGFPD
ncbi:SMP-30/gluconolactonase/LRE family protein [soil metagenome]